RGRLFGVVPQPFPEVEPPSEVGIDGRTTTPFLEGRAASSPGPHQGPREGPRSKALRAEYPFSGPSSPTEVTDLDRQGVRGQGPGPGDACVAHLSGEQDAAPKSTRGLLELDQPI